MKNIMHNQSLMPYNTFKIDINAKYLALFHNVHELKQILKNKLIEKEKILIIGEGSNILFTKDFNGLVLVNKIKGIQIYKKTQESVFVCVGAGENWHNFVLWSVKNGFSGIENLALIPGLVGASPIQNIGAYGVEVKDFITQVKYINLMNQESILLNNKECEFRYRDSIFKNKLKNKVVVTEVMYKLSKKPKLNISYSALKNKIKETTGAISTKSILKAVINIRQTKLPDPKKLANSGSFFKNPIVSNSEFEILKKRFPNIIAYKNSEKDVKLAAGWLIDNAGWKGHQEKNCGVHKNQALVLVNYDNATGQDIFNLAQRIKKSIKEKYNVTLEEEVTIL